jgi:autophagy-related protein 2
MVWLLPAFSLPIPYLPSNIQHRFVSYVLHKFLGRFVKAGALDGDQIDAQIGSGFVQVKDLVLDDQVLASPHLPVFI